MIFSQDQVPNPLNVIYGDQLALRGFYLAKSTVSAGSILPVELLWQAIDRPQAGFQASVQVFGGEDKLVAQCDQRLGQESQPTTGWAPDELYSQLCLVEMPVELPAGEYSLQIGLSTWPSLERLLISNDHGNQPDSFMMASVTVTD